MLQNRLYCAKSGILHYLSRAQNTSTIRRLFDYYNQKQNKVQYVNMQNMDILPPPPKCPNIAFDTAYYIVAQIVPNPTYNHNNILPK